MKCCAMWYIKSNSNAYCIFQCSSCQCGRQMQPCFYLLKSNILPMLSHSWESMQQEFIFIEIWRLHNVPYPEGMEELLIALFLSHHRVDWHAWGHETAWHRHWQVCTHRHRLWQVQAARRFCQSFLLCCFSLTCLIQSKTVSESWRRRKKRKKKSRDISSTSSHRPTSKTKLPFSFW